SPRLPQNIEHPLRARGPTRSAGRRLSRVGQAQAPGVIARGCDPSHHALACDVGRATQANRIPITRGDARLRSPPHRGREGIMGLLDTLLGGGAQRQHYQDFMQRYEQGRPWEGVSDEEATQHYSNVAQHLDPQDYRAAAEEAVSRLSPDEREELVEHM